MKHNYILCLAILCLFTACSTWRNVPEEMDTFVKKTESSAADYSRSDWEQSEIEYKALIEEYRLHEDDYTAEEKAQVMKSIGRYHALKLVYGVNETAGIIKSIKEIIPSYLKGVDEVVKEEGSGLSSLLKSILDPTDIKEAFDGLSSDLETLLEEVSDSLETIFDNFEGDIDDLLDEFD